MSAQPRLVEGVGENGSVRTLWVGARKKRLSLWFYGTSGSTTEMRVANKYVMSTQHVSAMWRVCLLEFLWVLKGMRILFSTVQFTEQLAGVHRSLGPICTFLNHQAILLPKQSHWGYVWACGIEERGEKWIPFLAGFGKLWPGGQIQPTTWFHKWSPTGAQASSFIPLPMVPSILPHTQVVCMVCKA